MFLIRAVMLAEIEKSNSVCGRVLIGIVVVCARGLGDVLFLRLSFFIYLSFVYIHSLKRPI